MAKVKVTLIKSPINRKEQHKRTVKGLGLKRMHHTVEHELTPSVQGMIDSIYFLLKVEPIS